MAIANYQIPSKLTFYPSYLQYAYAAGLINGVDFNTQNDITEEDVYKLAILYPSITSNFVFAQDDYIAFDLKNTNWNFDFGMMLGHDVLESGIFLLPNAFSKTEEGMVQDQVLSTSTLVNWSDSPSALINGWSAFTMSNLPNDKNGIGLNCANQGGVVNIGSLVFGKSWTAPQNVDLNASVSYNYGFKQKKTIGGKTISQMNYYKQSKWLLDAWELSDTKSDTRTEATESRNGLRTWSASWSFLQDKYTMNQNNMQNSEGWSVDDSSEYATGADGTSLYNSSDGIDFYTSVIKPTMGGHLSCIVKISESNNPDQWAIVRIKKYQISQKSPKLIDVKLTLEEQV